MDTKHIKISDYNYDLPDERIAKFPISQRDHSKLLVYKHGEVSDDVFFHLLELVGGLGLELEEIQRHRLRVRRTTPSGAKTHHRDTCHGEGPAKYRPERSAS